MEDVANEYKFAVADSLLDQHGNKIGEKLATKMADGKDIVFILFGAAGIGKSTILSQLFLKAKTLAGSNISLLHLPFDFEVDQVRHKYKKPQPLRLESAEWNEVSNNLTYRINEALFNVYNVRNYPTYPREPTRNIIASDLIGVGDENKGITTLRWLASRDPKNRDINFTGIIADPLDQQRAISVRGELDFLNRIDNPALRIILRPFILTYINFILSRNKMDISVKNMTRLPQITAKMARKELILASKNQILRQANVWKNQGLINPDIVELPDEVKRRLEDSKLLSEAQKIGISDLLGYYKLMYVHMDHWINLLKLPRSKTRIAFNIFLPYEQIYYNPDVL